MPAWFGTRAELKRGYKEKQKLILPEFRNFCCIYWIQKLPSIHCFSPFRTIMCYHLSTSTYFLYQYKILLLNKSWISLFFWQVNEITESFSSDSITDFKIRQLTKNRRKVHFSSSSASTQREHNEYQYLLDYVTNRLDIDFISPVNPSN